MALTDFGIKQLKPKDKPYRIADSKGLALLIHPNGSKYWQLRYRIAGTAKLLSLGVYPEVSLARARARRDEARQQLLDGLDPAIVKKQRKHAVGAETQNPFAVVAEAWYAFNLPKWAPATAEKCRNYLDKDILPALGERPIAEIGPAETAALIEQIEKRAAHNVAKKVRQWLRRIFSYAMAKGLATTNPASELKEIAAQAPPAEHYPYLLESELPAFLRTLLAYNGSPITKTAARLVILTANRPGVIRFAEWSEFDLDDGLWEIPAHKMKMRRPHLVPLPHQAVAMLRELHTRTGRLQFLFPGQGGYGRRSGLTISEGTINQCFARIGYKGRMTGHGSRHTASTLLHEHEWESRFIDAQLSHKDRDAPKIRSEYNHAIYLPQRRKMMQWYADYLDQLAAGNVVPAQFGRRSRATYQ